MLSMKDAILNCTLRSISQGDLDLEGTPDVSDLFDQLRDYRAKLVVGHPLKNAVLPDEVAPVTPVRPRKVNRHRKLGAKLAD